MKNILLLNICLFISTIASTQTFQHLVFDGEDDHVRYDNATALLGDAFSMTGWFYTDALEYGQGMMGLRDDAGGDGGFYMIQLNNGQIECRMQNSNGTLYEILLPGGTIKSQTWQHYTFTYGNGSISMYLDGNLISQKAAFGNLAGAIKPFVIGRSICCGINFYQDGKVDEVSLWSKELTGQEVIDIRDNEIDPNADNLELYYKFDQGIPGDNNTSVAKLKSETGNGERDADLVGFALQGSDSNFGGEIDVSSQIINFPLIENKLTSDNPFQVTATSSAGLPVTLTVISGPADIISGGLIALTGEPGTVAIAANQPGDGTFDPATEIIVQFEVIDPEENLVRIDAHSPWEGAIVADPDLNPIRLALFADIEYPELFEVALIQISVDGAEVTVQNEGQGYYTGWWTPPTFGNYEMTLTGTNNYGATISERIAFTISDLAEASSWTVADQWLDLGTQVGISNFDLPCYTGAYEKITARLDVSCPPGGCGEWDRIVNVEAQDETGRWIEIIRYITPYGTPCDHTLDVTDFASILHGQTAFRITNGTFDNGYVFKLDLEYTPGKPVSTYSKVVELWDGVYPFGDMADLQPTETLFADLPENLTAARLKLVSTGHGWGDNNTSNAAEFFRATHTVAVDDARVFDQDNWEQCNPNPDGCSPQLGTWQFNRAGWCPGAIARWFDFDMTTYKDQEQVKLNYIFNENYMDLCHPNNPNCVTNAGCNCDDGFNPELHVASSLILYSDSPIGATEISTDNDELPVVEHNVQFFPNPTSGLVTITYGETIDVKRITVINGSGQTLLHYHGGQAALRQIDLSSFSAGNYNLILESDRGVSTHMLIKK